MQVLEIAIQLSDLYEAVGAEGGMVATLIDKEVIPYLVEFQKGNFKGGIGLGDRFNTVIDKVRTSANRTGKDSIRTLRDMLKSALVTYVRKTHDAMTARDLFHRSVMSGSETMLTATAAVILANALHGPHSKEAQSLVQSIADRLSGGQHPASQTPAMENASGSASGAGAIAVGGKKKKPRKDSIFCEGDSLSWNDVQDLPNTIDLLAEIAECGCSKKVNGEMVDPSTAELVMSVHKALPPRGKKAFEKKPLGEMVGIAHRCIQRGLIAVVMEEA